MNILFVCTGNTCRSAMAEGLFKKMLKDRNISNIKVKSCGIAASSSYKVPPVVMSIMKEEGVDMSNHKSTMIDKGLVDTADIIFAMEESHKHHIILLDSKLKQKVFLLKDYILEKGDPNVPDPIGRSEAFYKKTAEKLKKYLEKLIDKVTS